MLVLEKASGRVKRVVDGTVQGAVLDLAVNSNSERGLLGIALHPNFASNGFVYLFWSESNTGADSNSSTAVDVLANRVDRFRWNGSSLTFDRNIIRFRAFQQDAGQTPRGNHNGGVIRFGPRRQAVRDRRRHRPPRPDAEPGQRAVRPGHPGRSVRRTGAR